MNIPQYKPLLNREELAKDLSKYLSKDVWLTEFKETQKFEEKIAEFLQMKHCVVANNGTISLSLALLACGVGPGDEVIVPALSMIATANAVKLIGAIPVFVDVESETLCLDPNKIEITEKTKALIYVTLNGRSGDINNLQRLCKAKNISFIEDSAQSFGSWYSTGERIGSQADISSFSFSMPKIITTGQGGCLCTNNSKFYKKIKSLKDFGRERSGIDIHPNFGINSKFTDLQAIIGLNQLKDIQTRITLKKLIYAQYRECLSDAVAWLPTNLNYCTPWFVDIYVENRAELMSYLKNKGIQTRYLYPSITKQKCYSIEQKFPVADLMSEKGLWLPSSLDITQEEIRMICSKIKKFIKG